MFGGNSMRHFGFDFASLAGVPHRGAKLGCIARRAFSCGSIIYGARAFGEVQNSACFLSLLIVFHLRRIVPDLSLNRKRRVSPLFFWSPVA